MQNQIKFNRGAVRPIQAFNDAGELLRGYYGGFLGVIIVGWLLIILAGFIPFAPLTPPLMCGIYLCLIYRAQGHQFSVNTLFKGFEYFGQSFIASLVVSVPMMIVSIVSMVILQIAMGGIRLYIESLNLDKNPKPSPEEVLPVLFGALGSFFGVMFLIVFGTILIAFILRMLIIFAYPLIVEYKMPGLEAVKLSIRALLGNFFGVIGLLILEFIFIMAGLMFFYIGAIFVLPFTIAAWFCAYRRVFGPVQSPNQINQAPPQYVWTPQGTSKLGRNLILSSFAIIAVAFASFGIGGFFLYQKVSQLIEKAQYERQQKIDKMPTTVPSTTPVPTSSNGKTSAKSSGKLQGQEVTLPNPDYPAVAKAVKAGGDVQVRVTINEKGEVVSASALSGHILLRDASEQAARKAVFKAQSKKTEGILIYTYSLN